MRRWRVLAFAAAAAVFFAAWLFLGNRRAAWAQARVVHGHLTRGEWWTPMTAEEWADGPGMIR